MARVRYINLPYDELFFIFNMKLHRQCCILEDHVTCGPNGGITGTGVIPGANPPKDQHYPGGCQNIDILGAHVYDTNGLNTPWADVMIIPTCNYHNNYQGNWNR